MKLKIIPLIGVLFWAFSIRSMAQTTITYAYDSTGNRTGRAVTTQLIAHENENQPEEVGSFIATIVKVLPAATELTFCRVQDESRDYMSKYSFGPFLTFFKKSEKKFAGFKKMSTFAVPFETSTQKCGFQDGFTVH